MINKYKKSRKIAIISLSLSVVSGAVLLGIISITLADILSMIWNESIRGGFRLPIGKTFVVGIISAIVYFISQDTYDRNRV